MFDQMDNEKLFAIKLADNEKKVREKSINQLRNYIRSRCLTEKNPFNEEDFIKLWKGLHYCMWMCDKPLVQVTKIILTKLILFKGLCFFIKGRVK